MIPRKNYGEDMAELPTYEVYAIRYATREATRAEHFIGGDPHDTLQPLAYFVWVIKGPAGTWLLDTGFDQAMAAKRKRHITHPIEEGLTAIGTKPDEVPNIADEGPR